MHLINVFVIPFFLFFHVHVYALPTYTDVNIQYTNGSVELDDLRLTDDELRWLNSKKQFFIAIDRTMHSSLLQTVPDQKAKGINVDYLGLLQQNLKVNIVLRIYPQASDAANALKNGDIDVMLTDLLNTRPKDISFNVSRPLITTYPVLVTTIENTMSPIGTHLPVSIARVKGYPANSDIYRSFPNATIIDYDDYYEALASVSSGDNLYFIGSNIVTSTLISRYFTHSLNTIKYYDCPCKSSFFFTRKEMPVLPEILNRFVQSLTNEVRRDVAQNWLNVGNLDFINQPLALTKQERKWIKKHPTVNVLVTSFHPPFLITDKEGTPRGMMGDLLNIIELQTGMKFVPVSSPVTSSGESLHPEGNWDIFPGAIYTEQREHQVAFTNALMMSPYVYVIKKDRMKIHKILPGMKVGLPLYYGLGETLKAQHPDVEWVAVDNASAAFHQVQEGKLDALVTLQPTAQYMLDHYYPDSQIFFRIQDIPRAAITFALPRGEPELKSIIDKALNNLPPSELLRLTEKWTKMPNVTIDTWDLYSQQFYIVTALAVSLIVSSLLWGFYLLREVNRRKAIQGDLENQISFRKALSDSLPNPSYVVEPSGLIASHNSAFAQYFTPEYYATASLPLTHPHSPFLTIMAEFSGLQLDEDGYRPIITCEFEISNGLATRYIKHWVTFCDMPASADRVFICGWEDITETHSLIHALEVEKNKAIDATVAKSQFLATMSHEIRTPVSSIMGFLELLASQTQSAEQQAEAMKLAYSTGQSLLGLIGEILDVDKIESGKYQLQPEWVSLADHLMMIYRAYHTLAARKNIALTLDSSIAQNTLVMIDPQAIKQVLNNLLSNALKFTEAGGVTLNASLTQEDNDTARLVIHVKDSGCGLSEEEQKVLFKPYSQTRCGRQQTGSGLGLLICKQLVAKMQGEISVKSCPGVGSTFSISIPVAIMSRKSMVADNHQNSCQLSARLKILIADDHPTNRLLLKRQLNTLGYAVTEACDGQDALIKASEQHVDLLITDINMPKLDGFELTQALRQKNHPLTIWGLTANAQTHERERALSHGMDLCLFKPLTLDRLKIHLSQLNVVTAPSTAYQHLDIERLQADTENDPELIREILMTFIDALHEDLSLAQLAWQEEDWPAFKKRIHRIHGSAGILNLIDLRKICHQLESLVTPPDAKIITKQMEKLEACSGEIKQEIAHYLTNADA